MHANLTISTPAPSQEIQDIAQELLQPPTSSSSIRSDPASHSPSSAPRIMAGAASMSSVYSTSRPLLLPSGLVPLALSPKTLNFSPAKLERRGGQGLLCRASSQSPSAEKNPVPYSLITGLAAAGLAESSFLAWTKVTQGAVACPLGGPGCSDVLNGDTSAVYGIPISVLGVAFYGAVSLLGLVNKQDYKWLLLSCTTAMSAASAYLIYIVVAKFEGASCTYCAASALLSLSLLLATLRGFNSKETSESWGLPVAVAASVVLALYFGFSQADLADAGVPASAVAGSRPAVESTVEQ